MPRFLVRIALGACICLSFVGSLPAAEQETAARPLPNAAQAKILAALDRPIEFDFQDRPFDGVIDYFEKQYGIEILLDNKALDDAGIRVNLPITLALKNITLRSALRLLLTQLDLMYVVGDGYLMITSKTEAETETEPTATAVGDTAPT